MTACRNITTHLSHDHDTETSNKSNAYDEFSLVYLFFNTRKERWQCIQWLSRKQYKAERCKKKLYLLEPSRSYKKEKHFFCHTQNSFRRTFVVSSYKHTGAYTHQWKLKRLCNSGCFMHNKFFEHIRYTSCAVCKMTRDRKP